MTQLFAQPYNDDAKGFYFDTIEGYQEESSNLKDTFGNIVEEFEIQFIDGENIDSELAETWGLNQVNFASFFDACDEWDGHEKMKFILAVGEGGYTFDHKTVGADDYEVDIYHTGSMKELAEQFVEEGLFGDVPKSFENYIDYDAIANDLSMDYAQSTVAGESVIWRVM